MKTQLVGHLERLLAGARNPDGELVTKRLGHRGERVRIVLDDEHARAVYQHHPRRLSRDLSVDSRASSIKEEPLAMWRAALLLPLRASGSGHYVDHTAHTDDVVERAYVGPVADFGELDLVLRQRDG